jgi:hypothetical protein
MHSLQQSFSDERHIRIYNIYKELFTLHQIRSGANDYFLPAVMNGRNAYDHMMRGMSAIFSTNERYGTDKNSREEYIRNTSKSAILHLQRASYDLVDKLALDAREEYNACLRRTNLKTVYRRVPNFNECRESIFKYTRASEDMRMDKDAEDTNFERLSNHIHLLKIMLNRIDLVVCTLTCKQRPKITESREETPLESRDISIEDVFNEDHVSLYNLYKRSMLHYEEQYMNSPIFVIIDGMTAYDRLMRIFTPVMGDLTVKKNIDHMMKNLTSGVLRILQASMSHCILSLDELLRGFSKKTVVELIPDYPDMKSKLESLEREIDERVRGSILTTSVKELKNYFEEVKTIEEWIYKIGPKMNTMCDYKTDGRKWATISILIGAALSVIGGYALKYL